jgi:L-amino acid N-acyltransferase YncA
LKGVIEILIRKAELEDAGGIAKVHVDSWRTTYKGIVPETFLESLSYENRELIWKNGIKENHVYIPENENGQVIGFSTGGKERTGKYETYTGELNSIYLLKEYQGQGIGRSLFQAVVDDLKVLSLFRALGLHALNDNPRQRVFPVLELRQFLFS